MEINSPEVLDGIKAVIPSSDVLQFGPEVNTKTLGLLWSCKSDNFFFRILIPADPAVVTKRVMLSNIARIFDPLQERVKWKQGQGSLCTGTMVLLKDDNQPPSRWRLGRVVEVHPGQDQIVR
ncbi:hypothetical protein NQ318_005464 [Aromia moschata]|uniref:DUF5641 domain-containing protein n=1 Tax=Aromia moschata TaxID=1265417 RepID=A0AAV8YWG2_9CUCU|nr:hypothetical protein NQ318_005464 [Aromia moschata]